MGDEPLSLCNDDWSITAHCHKCGHMQTLGRLSGIPGVKKLKTARQLRGKLVCTNVIRDPKTKELKLCNARGPELTAEFVGKRR